MPPGIAISLIVHAVVYSDLLFVIPDALVMCWCAKVSNHIPAQYISSLIKRDSM